MLPVLLITMLSLPPLCLTSRQSSAGNLIGRHKAASERIGRQATTAGQLMGLSGEAGFRSVRLSWRLENQGEKKAEATAEHFQIRYCENQVHVDTVEAFNYMGQLVNEKLQRKFKNAFCLINSYMNVHFKFLFIYTFTNRG
jgi:hypothetical protein